jgi:hypothetical protein
MLPGVVNVPPKQWQVLTRSSHYGRLRAFVAQFAGHFVELFETFGLFDKVADKVCRQSLQTFAKMRIADPLRVDSEN